MCNGNHLKGIIKNRRATSNSTTGGQWDSQMVQQLLHTTNPYGTLCLCLDPTQPNLTLIRQIHRGQTVDDAFQKKIMNAY